MPYARKKNADGTYRVVNSATGEVHAASTSKKNADAQIRLLHGVDNGWRPTHRFGKGKK